MVYQVLPYLDPKNKKSIFDEHYIRGKQGWFTWKELLDTLKDEKTEEKKPEAGDKP